MDLERELLKGNTPTLVLAVLRDGPLHGYGIAREIDRRSRDALKCREGTLYPTLRTLEQDGLIAGEWTRDGGRDRRVYTLTPEGHAALERRSRAWTDFAAAVNRVIQGDHHGGSRERTTSAAGGFAGCPEPSG